MNQVATQHPNSLSIVKIVHPFKFQMECPSSTFHIVFEKILEVEDIYTKYDI